MEANSKRYDIMDGLGSMRESNSDLDTKIAILSFHKIKYPKYIEILIIILEYSQIIAQIVLFALGSTNKQINLTANPFLKGIYISSKLFNPFFDNMSLNDGDPILTGIIFSMLICYIIMKHASFIYVVGKVRYGFKDYNFLINIWGWIFKLQGRVLCFIFTSFWIQMIKNASKNDFGIFGIKNPSIIILSCVMITIEYLESFYISCKYYYVLPSKNFLSEKNSYMQVISLTQKLLLQVLYVCLSFYSFTNAWIFCLVCLVTDLLRNLYYLTRLPLSNIKAIFFQGSLLMMITSFNISWILSILLKFSINYEIESFICFVWVILFLLANKALRLYLKRFILEIVTSYKNISPELLIHKIGLIKQIRENASRPYEYNQNFGFYCLLKETISKRIETILNVKLELTGSMNFDMDSKEAANKIFLQYLENLLANFPESKIVKLYLAYFCAKKMKLYGRAVKIIKDLRRTHGQIISLNASLLIFDIQNIVNSRYYDQNIRINLSEYVKSQTCFAQLKHKVYKQIQITINLNREIIKEKPRALEIINLSQSNYSYHNEIEKQIDEMLEIIPENFIEPLAFLTCYFTVNHSLSEALKYRTAYLKKLEKYKQYFDSEKLSPENIYQSTNAFVLFSGEKTDAGTVLYCSKSIESITGREAQFMIGKPLTSLVVPALQHMTNTHLKLAIESETLSMFNVILHNFGGHHEGHMIETEYYSNIFPFVNGNYCFASVIRRVPTSRECLLISKNGDIEASTKNIRQQLGLKADHRTVPNIKLINPELAIVNEELNREGLFDKNNDEKELIKSRNFEIYQETEDNEKDNEIEKAKDLCSIYKNKGKTLVLNSLMANEPYQYHCKLLNIVPGTFQKIFEFQKVDKNKTKEKLDNLSPTIQGFKSKNLIQEDLNHSPQLKISARYGKNPLDTINSDCSMVFEPIQKRTGQGLITLNLLEEKELITDRPSLKTFRNQKDEGPKTYKTSNGKEENMVEGFLQKK